MERKTYRSDWAYSSNSLSEINKVNQLAKADEGKPRLTLVPQQIIYDIAEVREYGCEKYPTGGEDNWKMVEAQRYRNAAFRHFLKYLKNPEDVDAESGINHLKHLACNIAFLCEIEHMHSISMRVKKVPAND